jgi:hypothetical protein
MMIVANPIGSLALVVGFLFVTSCNRESKSEVVREETGLCSAHGTRLSSKEGFSPGPEVMGDPPSDYLRFDSEERFPHALPWDFTVESSEIQSEPASVLYCPECEAGFQKAFGEFRMLPEAGKVAHEEAMLRRLIEREKSNRARE